MEWTAYRPPLQNTGTRISTSEAATHRRAGCGSITRSSILQRITLLGLHPQRRTLLWRIHHPNFASPYNYFGDFFFGELLGTLGQSLGSGGGSGGLNHLYQIGGPRSIQLALKLQF